MNADADMARRLLAMGQSQLGCPPVVPKHMADQLRAMGVHDGFHEITKLPTSGTGPTYVRRDR